MATSASSDTELLTEHLGYPPVSLLDDIINSVNILAERALDAVEKNLLSKPSASLGFRPTTTTTSSSNASSLTADEAHRLEIESGTHALETLLCASIDRNFDKFELYIMRYILVVAPEDRDWVRLAHYDGLDLQQQPPAAGPKPDAPDPASINALRRKLQASQRLNATLHAEQARGAELLRQLRAVAGSGGKGKEAGGGPLAFLRDTGGLSEGDAQAPLQTTAAFTLSQLQALRALSTSLRNVMPDLAGRGGADGGSVGGGGGGEDGAAKGWRRERLEYVEGATRKHLENVRGLELGRNGEVQDGEWQGEGRDLGRGEVQGLEKVVTFLGAGPESAAGRADEMDES